MMRIYFLTSSVQLYCHTMTKKGKTNIAPLCVFQLYLLQLPGCCNSKFNIKYTVGSNTGKLHVNGTVGRDTSELCQLSPFVVVWQNTSGEKFMFLLFHTLQILYK